MGERESSDQQRATGRTALGPSLRRLIWWRFGIALAALAVIVAVVVPGPWAGDDCSGGPSRTRPVWHSGRAMVAITGSPAQSDSCSTAFTIPGASRRRGRGIGVSGARLWADPAHTTLPCPSRWRQYSFSAMKQQSRFSMAFTPVPYPDSFTPSKRIASEGIHAA